MPLLQEIHVAPIQIDRFAGVAPARHLHDLRRLADGLRVRLGGRVVWNISSTAAGGGVAEMLQRLVGYARGAGFDARWLVIAGNTDFFRVTKRLHNALHGERGDGSALDSSARAVYEDTLRENAAGLGAHVRRGDIVFLHDPQTAGLIPSLAAAGGALVWRCHVGADERNAEDRAAWEWLRPYLEQVHQCVFTRTQYVPDYLQSRSTIIPPTIDPLSPKNQPMTAATVHAILAHAGVVDGRPTRGRPVFRRTDGTPTRVERKVQLVSAGGPPPWDTPIIAQVSRWDRLKDPAGVLRGFASFVADPIADGAHLMLAGPQSAAVTDDPEGAEVYAEVAAQWAELPQMIRRRVHLVSLPMEDIEENAAIVNALQRHAKVVVQKSLREGFGLTVTEAMWKARPVIGSDVGGIHDQIESGKSGLLVDPHSIDEFRAGLIWMFADAERAQAVGKAGRARVRSEYLGVHSLLRWGALLGRTVEMGTTP